MGDDVYLEPTLYSIMYSIYWRCFHFSSSPFVHQEFDHVLCKNDEPFHLVTLLQCCSAAALKFSQGSDLTVRTPTQPPDIWLTTQLTEPTVKFMDTFSISSPGLTCYLLSVKFNILHI